MRIVTIRVSCDGGPDSVRWFDVGFGDGFFRFPAGQDPKVGDLLTLSIRHVRGARAEDRLAVKDETTGIARAVQVSLGSENFFYQHANCGIVSTGTPPAPGPTSRVMWHIQGCKVTSDEFGGHGVVSRGIRGPWPYFKVNLTTDGTPQGQVVVKPGSIANFSFDIIIFPPAP